MLQPRESKLLWRRRKRRHSLEGLCCKKFFYTIVVIGCLTLLPQGLTQHNDDVYVVKPTPALRLGKEELTTVLLVNNNENHGRYINVRPEVGLLTSTARTFIQEGVTTEYATQVVGTTLDNGRVYAQYLKKSSRVLYDSGSAVPSVVTSWVGESLHSEAGFLPQSHNDLINADQPDWQAIDDRLLSDQRHEDNFVGNTDYVGLRRNAAVLTSSKVNEVINSELGNSWSYTENSKPAYSLVAQLGALEENARKVAANKVLPIGDLPTYTIKQNYEPSVFLVANDGSELGDINEAFGRNPKLIYKQVLRNSLKAENITTATSSSRPTLAPSRHFATVTYYGFADFTTVVGDSVIVFSPSTSTNNLNYAHVTSIRGEATLGNGLPQGPSISKVSITIAQDIIEPTMMQQPAAETLLERPVEVMTDVDQNTASFSSTEVMDEDQSTATKEISTVLETSEVVVHPTPSEIPTSPANTREAPVMLSRPSDEEIFRIFNALANAEADKTKTQSSANESITNVTTSLAADTTTRDEVQLETSNAQTFGGATTIFFEDDPFANFVLPSKTDVHPLESTATLHNNSNSLNEDNVSVLPSALSEDIQIENSTAASKSIEATSEQGKIIETTTEQALSISEETLTTADTTPDSVTKQSLLPDVNNAPAVLSNVLIKEIDPANEDAEVLSDCISTSQVFLTQLPKTVTLLQTMVVTDTAQLRTEVREEIQPTFEIKEATKYYCIQASTIQADPMETQLINPPLTNMENEDVVTTTYKADHQTDQPEEEEQDNTEFISNTTKENIFEMKTTAKPADDLNDKRKDISEHADAARDNDDEKDEEDETEEASGQAEEYGEDENDEEIELIYKTLYTTYTYLTTFFHDESTSISSHTEVVTNVMTSTLGINLTKESTHTNLNANLDDNEINPTGTLYSTQMKSTKRFVVPSEVESFIRTDEEKPHESLLDSAIVASKSSEALATFYTTYTYYTTIFAEGDTEIMSHTEVVTNIKKSSAAANFNTAEVEQIVPTSSFQLSSEHKGLSSSIILSSENAINYNSLSETDLSATPSSATAALAANEMAHLPNIPDLGDLSAITLVTDVRSSSSPGNKQIINNFEAKPSNEKEPQQQLQQQQQQQQPIFEDQISSESNTDTDEIMPSATLLLQTSFTTFTYYTTMYSGDKTNIISRLETMTNTVTETLQLSKAIDLEAASLPITYFTTFTYWTKLARDGQITTLSREETISNVIIPTSTVQQLQSQPQSQNMNLHGVVEHITTTEASVTNETTLQLPKSENEMILHQATTTPTTAETLTNSTILEPTTYYTTYTYYTTSYETEKTITDSRFETVTNIITPTVTLKNNEERSDDPATLVMPTVSSSLTPAPTPNHSNQIEMDLILYDFKKIIDADGVSTIFFTTEIRPTLNAEGVLVEVVSSSSSLLINDEKRSHQATAATESSTATLGPDGQTQKQYKTGLVRLIEGTRIANRTTTLYQSKVIGTIIDQRYAQIIESTSSFIFEKTQAPAAVTINPNSLISPTSSTDIENMQATEQVSIPVNSVAQIESSIVETSAEQEIETTTKSDAEVDEEENSSKADEKLRFPFQTKKPPFISPLKPFSNRNRPQFAPKKNSSATIITRSDFTPTITATPALKSVSRFSSTRRGSGSGNGISSSNPGLFATSSRRFGRPSKSSISGGGLQASSSLSGSSSRNRFASSSNTRGSYASSSRRLGGPSSAIRPSFSRPSLFSSGFASNSRHRVRPTTSADFGEVSSTVDISTAVPNSQEEGISQSQDESDDEEENTTESNRRQNNPLLRLRRPLNRPQGFTPARSQQPNSPNNGVSVRRNPLSGRARNGNTGTVATTTTTTTAKPKPRTFQPPLIPQNRIRPTNSLFPPRNIFGVQKAAATTEENRDLSEEDTNENIDDSEYEDEDDEESDVDEDEETSRRRRSSSGQEPLVNQKTRSKREADSSQQNRSNFRNRFRRPKLASATQAESKNDEDEGAETKETVSTGVPLTASTPRTRSRFANRYSGHAAAASTTTAATTAAAPGNHKAIRPTRPTNNNSGRAQFTLREKDSSVMSTTQKGLTPVKRPSFRRPQPGSSGTSRRLPSSTASSSSTSGKRRLKAFTNNDATTTTRNSVTGRSRTSSTASARSRASTPARDSSNTGSRNRGRNNNYNNNEGLTLDNSGTITVTHFTPAEVTIPVVNGKITEYKQVVTAKTSIEVLGPQQYTTLIASNGVPQLALTREDSSVNYNGATEITKYILHETPTTSVTFTPTKIRGRKTSYSHVLPSTVYSVEQLVSTVQPQISANAPLANILLSQLLLGNVGLPAANPLLGALGGALTQPGLGTALGPPQQASPVTEYKTHASTYVTTLFEGQSTVLPVTFQGKKILTTVFDTTAQTITATEFITDTIVTTPTVMAQAQPVVNSLLLQQILLQQHLQQQQQQQQQQPTPDSNQALSAVLNSVPAQFLLGGDNLQELEASNNIRGSGHNDLLNEDDDFAVGSSVDLDDIALQAQAQTHKNGRKKTRKNASQEIQKQFQHFDSGQDATNSDTFFQGDLAPFPSSYDYSNGENNNKNDPVQIDDIDEARYNLATRIMSNGVEVIIASDKTKTPDHILGDISNSQLQYNKPMTLAASTIKNQMMILLFPSSLTATDDSSLIQPSVQQLNYDLPFHINHFITKTCLTTYTYRTTYVQDGRTTVESREKVISNIATEERSYPKITPTQTKGVTLTKTPELAVGIFPTTYSYANTFKDNSDNLQVMTSEYTVVNTITGPNDYIAYLQPLAKATPALKTNTYYDEVTLSQKIKSKMHTVKTNLTQVVVTKSYTPAHSTSVITSYYAYDDDSLQDFNENYEHFNLLTTAPTTNAVEEDTEKFNNDRATMINNDLHIYATKTFLTTFTYYTTTVLSSYLAESIQTELGIKPMSTVFNYYTRVIENVITDSVPATLLPNELLTKMKIELRKQKPNQRSRLFVTTATLKDGQTVKISAIEIYKGNLPPAAYTPTPTTSHISPTAQTLLESFNHSQEKIKEDEEADDDFQTEESSNLPPALENFKHPENQEPEEENNNGIDSLPSEQILTVVKVPNEQTPNVNMPVVISEKPSSTTAANQLIQRLTALKPMFNAMADLLQSNFGVTRDTIKPIKNIESKQAPNKKINSSALNATADTKHPIYIPVQKSPLKKNPHELRNYTEFIPQSLHIKPPLFLNEEHHFESNDKEKASIIPLSTLTAPRQEQPLHNGGIYIRPGEIITANSDVIIGKPNGIEYIKIPNHLNVDTNTSKAYALDNRQFQVTYYHNKVQHPPYKKKSSSASNAITHKPQHIQIMNNNLTPHSAYGLRHPNEQNFNKNILKPPPPPPLQPPIPIHASQGLSLILTAPDKPPRPPRTRNKPQQYPILTNGHPAAESTTPLHLHSPTLQAPPIHQPQDFLPSPLPPPPRGAQNFYNLNHELKNNEILEIQQIPSIFTANLKSSLMHNNINLTKPTPVNRDPQPTQALVETNTENQIAREQQTLATYMRVQPQADIEQAEKDALSSEYFPQYVASSANWKSASRRAPQIKTSATQDPIELGQNTNLANLDENPKPEMSLKGSSVVWNLQNNRPTNNNQQFSSHTNRENSISLQNYHNLQRRPTLANAASNNLSANKEIFYDKSFPTFQTPLNTFSQHEKGIHQSNRFNYSNDAVNKNHQNISLDQYIFSHTVDVNVPPLTFNRDDNDYPQQTAAAVRGQIPPTMVKELKAPAGSAYKYMPLITIPANEQQVQVSLTPQNSLGALTLSLELPNEPTWNKEAANDNSNNNNILRKISLLNDNFKQISNGVDQKTLATDNILTNIKPKPEPTWKHHKRQQQLSSYSRLNNKLQFLVSTTKPVNKPNLPQAEPAKNSKTEQESFKSNQNGQQPRKVPAGSHLFSKATTQNILSAQPTSDFKYPAQQVAQTHQSPAASELNIANNQTQYTKVNYSGWLVAQKHNSESKLKHVYPSIEQQTQTNDQNRLTRVATQKMAQLANNINNPPSPTTTTTGTSTTTFKTTTTSEATTPQDINKISNTNESDYKPILPTHLLAQGAPFKKNSPKTAAQDNELLVVRNKTAAIFVAHGEAFSAATNKKNNDKQREQQPPANKTPVTEQNLLTKEIFLTGETQYPESHIQKIFAKATTLVGMDGKLSTLKTNTAATETVLGLQPPPRAIPAYINTSSISILPSYSLSNGNEQNSQTNKKRQPINSGKMSSPPRHKIQQIIEKNARQRDANVRKGPNITTPATQTTNHKAEVEASKSHNRLNLATHQPSEHFESESRKSNESFKLINLKPSEVYERKIFTTTTSLLADSIRTFTTTTTTTIKRIVLPTKYITNKRFYTVTTTASAPPPPPLLPTLSSHPLKTTSFLSTTETTTEVTTLYLTHTQINTIVDTVTSVKTLEPVTITATTTVNSASSTALTEFATPQSPPLAASSNPNPSFVTTEPQIPEIHQDLTYLPYPSVEVVSANATQGETGLNPNENSIFIIMSNNKNRKNTVHKQLTSLQGSKMPPESVDDNNNILQIDETHDVMLEHDNGITFDDIQIRDEQPGQIVNGKSVESSAFVNNVASVKESSSDSHVILGGVLIATPPKFSNKHSNISDSVNVGCHSKCKASRNEHCELVDSHWSCLCRPGFARMFPDRPCKPTYTFELLLRAVRVGNYPLQYVNELGNNKTEHYKHLSQLVINALDRMIMQSDFRDAYHGVEVTDFADGYKNQRGILVNVLLQLSDNSNEKRLEEVFKKSLRLSNYSIGGTDLYTNKIGVDALAIKDFNECLSRKLHDCSENAHCFNLPGTYTCSCAEGFVDLSDNPIYPGRICSSEQIGCEMCHYHGKCSTWLSNFNDRNFCECFPWYAGSKCQVNLKILLIVLLGIGTLLFILLLFCILITCTKRRNYHQHTALAPSTVTSSSEGLQKNSRLATNMIIASVGLRSSSLRGVNLKNNKRQKIIKIDKRAMIKDSSSETSQNSLTYTLKNRESIAGSCNKKTPCLLKHSSKKHRNSGSLVNSMEQYSVSIPTNIQIEGQSDLNTVITTASSFKDHNHNPQTEQQNLLGNANEHEGHYCEQSDRSLTVMIPRAKFHSSVLSQTQLMHHQLTMERVHKTAKPDNKFVNADKETEPKRSLNNNFSAARATAGEEKRAEIPSNPGALISAGFEVSAIVRDNMAVINSGEQHNDLVRFDSMPPNYTITTTSDPATSLDSSSDQKHILNEEIHEFASKSNKQFSTNDTDYNVYKCEKDLIETMDEWLGNVKLNVLSAEARSFDETTIRASTKPLRVSVDGTQTKQLHDEVNTMAERDLSSTFLLPHTHLYKPERQESELSGFDSF